MRGDDGAHSVCVKLWSTGTAKDLKDIENTKIDKGSLFSIIDLCAL